MIEAVSQAIYFDTTIFLDAFEGAADHSDQLRTVFKSLGRSRHRAVTSELTLAELFGKVSDKGWVWQRRFYLDLIVFNGLFDLRPVTRDVLIETGAFRKAAREAGRAVHLADAVHAVTAIQSDCLFVFTSDQRFSVPASMERLLPDPQGFAALTHILDE